VPTQAVVVPEKLARNVRFWWDDRGAEFLPHLGPRLAVLQERWNVRVGPPFVPGGATAYIAPATLADGRRAVVKISIARPEARHEGDALRHFGGVGAIELLAEDFCVQSYGLLLERCLPGTPLREQPDDVTLTVAANLLRRLWRPAPDHVEFDSLSTALSNHAWLNEEDERLRPGREQRLVAKAQELLRWLPTSTSAPVVLHGDFHPGNVLAASREAWLAVDPKPLAGDPAYDAVGLVCQVGDLLGDPGPQRAIGARIGLLEELLRLDGERIRLWAFATAVQASRSSLALGDRSGSERCMAWATALDRKIG